MKQREFVYVGDTLPDIDRSAFILTYKKAVIAFLMEKNLLTSVQSRRCIEKLKNNI